jgi:hypothetical protein
MKRNYKVEELKYLRKLFSIACETTIEAIEKRGPFAFINNGFALIGLGNDLKEIAEEVKYIQKQPDLINEMIDEESKKYGTFKDDVIFKTCRKVYGGIIYNVSLGLDIGEDWKQHNEEKEKV